jgi:hypothetical protein
MRPFIFSFELTARKMRFLFTYVMLNAKKRGEEIDKNRLILTVVKEVNQSLPLSPSSSPVNNVLQVPMSK